MSAPSSAPLAQADRLRKLRAMSAGEIWTRVRYGAYCRIEKARHARGALAGSGRLRGALVPELARASDWKSALLNARARKKARFYSGAEAAEATRALFVDRFADERRRAREEAERVVRREFSFFGETFRYPKGVDWHADPVSGRQWPQVYHRDVPVDGGNVGYGDVKYVWELGRHQFVIDLGRGWALEGDPRFAATARELVSDWRAANPIGTGVGWSCALEPAFRALSWLWGYFLTVDDPALDPDAHVEWLEGLHDHGWFLYRHLEYYASPFNHLIGEACALYCLGVLFPEFREASKWRAHARDILESRLPTEFYADGGSVEQSTFYHHATTGFYLLAAILGRQNGEELSPAVWAAIERAIEFSMVMQQPDGTTPRIGGADDGKPIRLEHLPFWDFRPYQAIGAVLFGRADFKAAAGRFHEDALWLLGPEGAAEFDRLPASAPTPASRTLPSSGYVVLRNRFSADADYVCFDCGEQAAGLRRDDVPSAAHGHADCLAILVWRGGRPVLIDAGFHCYNGPKAWQDHFRETAAHNTLRIDGSDQARHINKMAWAQTYAATLEAFQFDEAQSWAIGTHDGYRRLQRGPVLHRRAVWARQRYVVVCDFLEGSGRHDVELGFQFAPGRLRVMDGCASFEDRANLHWFAPMELTAQVHEGGPTPDAGWIAPSLGMKEAAPRLVLAATTDVPVTLVTVVADAGVSVRTSTDLGVIVIGGNGWTESLTVRGLGDRQNDHVQTDGWAAVWRHEGEQLVPDGRIGGTFQRP